MLISSIPTFMSSPNNDHENCPILLKYSTTVQATEHSHVVVLDISLSCNMRRRHWCRPQKERSRTKYYLPVHVTLIEVPCPRSWVENYCSISIYKRPGASLAKVLICTSTIIYIDHRAKRIYNILYYTRENSNFRSLWCHASAFFFLLLLSCFASYLPVLLEVNLHTKLI